MAKALAKYRGFTPTEIKTRAEVPGQGDMSVDSTYVYANDISTTKIRNVLGAGNNIVSSLCAHANINQWSGFSPKILSVSSKTLVISNPSSNYSIGSFAGYNHGAQTPGYSAGPYTADLWVPTGGDAIFVADLYVGELQYHLIGGIGAVIAVYDGGTLVGWGASNFINDTIKDNVSLSATLTGLTIQKTYTVKCWITNDTATFDTADELCRVPNTSDYNVTVKIRQQTTWYYGNSGTQTIGGGWVQSGSPGLNLSTGYFNIGNIYIATSFTQLRVYVSLINWLGQLVQDTNFFNGAYSAYTNISGSLYTGLAPIANTGYTAIVQIEEDV